MRRIAYEDGTLLDRPTKKNMNYISTTLYHFYDFLPRALFNQVKKFTNIYFIAMSVLTLFDDISPFSPVSFIAPVVFVICFSMAFDLYEDFRRYLRDRKLNHARARVYRESVWKEVKFKNVVPGDLIFLQNDQEICADMILLSYKNTSANAYIETANLDGEKSLKPKKGLMRKFMNIEGIFAAYPQMEISYKPNVESLEKFDAFAKLITSENKEDEVRLTMNNFLPRGCVIKNTSDVIGLVVYTGHETKIMKNTKFRIFKESTLEKKMNKYILVLVLVLLLVLIVISLYSVLKRKVNGDFILAYLPQEYSYGVDFILTALSYFLILNTILPISLIITLQIAKTLQKVFFMLEKRHTEKQMTIHTLNINEELGQIEYVLSDKTGTLTQNKMIARHFQILAKTLNFDDAVSLYEERRFMPFILQSKDEKAVWEVKHEVQFDEFFFIGLNTCHECFAESTGESSKPKNPKEVNMNDFETNLLNPPETSIDNKTSTIDYDRNYKTIASNKEADRSHYDELKNHIEIQGPHPDEIALLRASKNFCGYLFKGSDTTDAVIYTNAGNDIEVKVLLVNKFDSFRKMMSAVIEWEGKKFIIAKGADSAIVPKLRKSKNAQDHANEQLITAKVNKFVDDGLRILMVATRMLSDEEWQQFDHQLREASQQAQNSDQETQQVLSHWENEMQLIGATAIEDKLQENLKESLTQIRKADIKIWVITGDKLETAENIAYSSGLYDRSAPLYKLRSEDDILSQNFELRQNLIIEGELLGHILTEKGEILERFKDLIMSFSCVVFCRTNANQKVEIVRIVKSKKKITLAIGDGANDVNMIQEANVGVGISGHEGKQASNASDFSISQFSYLPELIFTHGRTSYHRTSQMILYFFYKNFMFTFPQLLYGFFTDFSRSTVYIDWYITLFNLIFTAFPVGARGVFDKDFNNMGIHTRYLEIYTYYYGKENKLFNPKKFIFWLLGGILETSAIFFFLFFAYHDKPYAYNHALSYDFFSITLYAIIIFYLDIKIIYITNIFTLNQYLGYLAGVGIYLVYIIVTNYITIFGIYRSLEYSWATVSFWMAFVFMNFFLFTLMATYYKIRDMYVPSVKTRAYKTISKKTTYDTEELIKGWAEEEKRYHGFLAKLYY